MTTGSAGAVFFLGTRAHYQVLNQPETRSLDTENGNASTETIYPNSGQDTRSNEKDNIDFIDNNWNCDLGEVVVSDKDGNMEIGTGVKRRSKRCASEVTLCDRDSEFKPAQLNNLDSDPPKPRVWRARLSLAAFLSRLARRRTDPPAFRLHSALTQCTYREACRCLDCQSRYFECDEDSEDYSSDDSEYSRYLQEYQHNEMIVSDINYENGNPDDDDEDDDDDDEVFIDTIPGDNTSTDLLIDKSPAKPEMTSRYVDKMSISSSDLDEESLQLEVAAGTPALLNYLLTHPVTCSIQ